MQDDKGTSRGLTPRSPCRIDPEIFSRCEVPSASGGGLSHDLDLGNGDSGMATGGTPVMASVERVGALKKSGSTSRRQESIEKWVNSITTETQDVTTEGAVEGAGTAATTQGLVEKPPKDKSTLTEDDLSLGAEARMMKIEQAGKIQDPQSQSQKPLECNNNNVPPVAVDNHTAPNRQLSWRTKLALMGLIRMDSIQSDVEVKQYESVEEVLQDRVVDPEVVLSNLGFGRHETMDATARRIPERFLTNKSRASGISVGNFLDMNPDVKKYAEAKGIDVADASVEDTPQFGQASFAKVAQTVTMLKRATTKMRQASRSYTGVAIARSEGDEGVLLHLDPIDYVAPSGETFSSILHPDNCHHRAAQGLYDGMNKGNLDGDGARRGPKILSGLQRRRDTLHRLHQVEPLEEEFVDGEFRVETKSRKADSRGPSPLPYPVARDDSDPKPKRPAKDSKGSPLPYPIWTSLSPSNSPFATPHQSQDEPAKDHGIGVAVVVKQPSGGDQEPTTPVVDLLTVPTYGGDDNNNSVEDNAREEKAPCLESRKVPVIEVTPSVDESEITQEFAMKTFNSTVIKQKSGTFTIHEDQCHVRDQNANEIHEYANEVTEYAKQLAKQLGQSNACDRDNHGYRSTVSCDSRERGVLENAQSRNMLSSKFPPNSPGGSTGVEQSTNNTLVKPSLEEMGIVQQSFELEEILSGDLAQDDLSHHKDKQKDQGLHRGGSLQSDSSGFAESLDPVDTRETEGHGGNKVSPKHRSFSAKPPLQTLLQETETDQGIPHVKGISHTSTSDKSTMAGNGDLTPKGVIQMYENSPQMEAEKFDFHDDRMQPNVYTSEMSVQAGGDLNSPPEKPMVGQHYELELNLNDNLQKRLPKDPTSSLDDSEKQTYPKDKDPWLTNNNNDKKDAIQSLIHFLSAQNDSNDDEVQQISDGALPLDTEPGIPNSTLNQSEVGFQNTRPSNLEAARAFGEFLSSKMSDNEHDERDEEKSNIVYIKYITPVSTTTSSSSESSDDEIDEKSSPLIRRDAVRHKNALSTPTDVTLTTPNGAERGTDAVSDNAPTKDDKSSPKGKKKKSKKEQKVKHPGKPSALEALARNAVASSFEMTRVDNAARSIPDPSETETGNTPSSRVPLNGKLHHEFLNDKSAELIENQRHPDTNDNTLVADAFSGPHISLSGPDEENQLHDDPSSPSQSSVTEHDVSYDTKRPSFLMTDYDVLAQLVASANQTEESLDESEDFADARQNLDVCGSDFSMKTANSEFLPDSETESKKTRKDSTSSSSSSSSSSSEDEDIRRHSKREKSSFRERFLEQIASDDSQSEKPQRSSWPIDANIKVRYQDSHSSSDVDIPDDENQLGPQRDGTFRSTLTQSDMRYLNNLAISLVVPLALNSKRVEYADTRKSIRMSQRSNSVDMISELDPKDIDKVGKTSGKSDAGPLSKFMKAILHPKAKGNGGREEKSAATSLKKSETIATADDLKNRGDKTNIKIVQRFSKPGLLKKKRKKRSKSEPGKLNSDQIKTLSSSAKKKERSDSKGFPSWLKSMLPSPKSKAEKSSKDENPLSDLEQEESESKPKMEGISQSKKSHLDIPHGEGPRSPSSLSDGSSRWGVTDSDAEDFHEQPPGGSVLATLAAQTASANSRILSTMSDVPRTTRTTDTGTKPIVSQLHVNLARRSESEASHKNEVLLVLDGGEVKEIKQLTPPTTSKHEGPRDLIEVSQHKDRSKNRPVAEVSDLATKHGHQYHRIDRQAKKRRGRRGEKGKHGLSDDEVFEQVGTSQGHAPPTSERTQKVSEIHHSITPATSDSLITPLPTGSLELHPDIAAGIPKGAYYIPYAKSGSNHADFQGCDAQPSGFIPLYATPAGYVLSNPVIGGNHGNSCPFHSNNSMASCAAPPSGFHMDKRQLPRDPCLVGTPGGEQLQAASFATIPQGAAQDGACQHRILSHMVKAASLNDLPIQKLLGEAPSWSVSQSQGGDTRQHLLNEVKLLQHAVHKYKLEFRALEIKITADYVALSDQLSEDDKKALDALTTLRSEIRHELSTMEDLLETRLRAIIAGTANLPKLPVDLSSLRVIQQMIELLKEQVYHNNIATAIHTARNSSNPVTDLSADVDQHDQNVAPQNIQSLMHQLAMLQHQIETQQVTTATILGSQLKELKDTLVEEIRHSVYAETQQLRLQVQSAETQLANIKSSVIDSSLSGEVSVGTSTSLSALPVSMATGTSQRFVAMEDSSKQMRNESPVKLRNVDRARQNLNPTKRLSLREELEMFNGASDKQTLEKSRRAFGSHGDVSGSHGNHDIPSAARQKATVRKKVRSGSREMFV